MLAEGGSSRVFLCKIKDGQLLQASGSPQCIAKISKVNTDAAKVAFDQEVAVTYHIQRHPNIAKMVGFSWDPLTILMQYYPNGSLFDWIRKTKMKCPPQIIANFSLDIARGLQHMHRLEVAHCDIKSANILLHQQGRRLTAVITDLGITKVLDDKTNIVAGFQHVKLSGFSMRYASPEAFREFREKVQIKDGILKARDIYALGCVMYEMIHQKSPWS
jgi:serine/threonine protein kinase